MLAADGGARSAQARRRVSADQHFTQPPPRYSEASLVKKMEELGIGRPSTYASILVRAAGPQLRAHGEQALRAGGPWPAGDRVPDQLLRALRGHRLHQPGWKPRLDDVSDGRMDWHALMRAFWDDFSKRDRADARAEDLRRDRRAGPRSGPAFPSRRARDGTDPRVCPACQKGRLGLKLGRHGSFIGCSNYPACQFTRRLAIEGGEGESRGPEGGHAHPGAASGDQART